MKFRLKPVVREAITFQEFVEYGLANGANIVNGVPWSFKYEGHQVTHENDECYLIQTLEEIRRFTPKDMLITDDSGWISPCSKAVFNNEYELYELD